MTASLASWIAATLYGASTMGLVWDIKHPARSTKTWVMSVLTVAVFVHLFLLHDKLFVGSGIALGFFNVGLLVAWLISSIILIASLNQPLEKLGLLGFPIIAGFLVFQALYHAPQTSTLHLSLPVKLHVISALVAYSLFAIAAIQAILLSIQDKRLKRKHTGGIVMALPPLHHMEQLLFKIIAIALITLTCSLVIGTIYVEDLLGQHLAHKTILSWISWCIFAFLLVGRWRFGWRGQTAMKWTITGFIFLVLAYFGTQFVLELVLQR